MTENSKQKLPFLPLYPADYMQDTQHLSTLQHGAYLLLIMNYWIKGSLPDDDEQLARIARLPLRDWLRMRQIMHEFFYDDWRHKRIDAEIEKAKDKSIRRSEAGKRGGDAKSLKNHDAPLAIAVANGVANGVAKGVANVKQTSGKPLASSSDSTYQNKEEVLDLDISRDSSDNETPSTNVVQIVRSKSRSEQFDQFWNLYPHKVSKKASRLSFDRVAKSGVVSFEKMMSALAVYIKTKPLDRSWMNATTWLNQARWDDEPAARSPLGSTGFMV